MDYTARGTSPKLKQFVYHKYSRVRKFSANFDKIYILKVSEKKIDEN